MLFCSRPRRRAPTTSRVTFRPRRFPRASPSHALGGDAEPVTDTLYEVDVPGGPDLLTHGPDLQLDAAQERATGFSAGAPERPPVCATDNYQQILYGHLATAPDRLASVKGAIRSQMMRTNALLNQDSLDSGGPTADYKMLCDSSGQIDVQGFTATGATFSEVVAGARLAGFKNPAVDYTIFFDDPTSNACGVGSYYNDERLTADNRSNTGGGFGVAYSDCWFGSTPMHENGHNQGAVQRGAPYSTGTGGHCWDEQDVMCYAPDGGDLHQEGTIERCADRVHFDCGYDTYFDTAPEPGEYLATHWNIGSSLNRFLVFGGGNVTVENTAPGAGFEFSCAGANCQFSDTSSDSDGTIADRYWDFGDGFDASRRRPLTQLRAGRDLPGHAGRRRRRRQPGDDHPRGHRRRRAVAEHPAGAAGRRTAHGQQRHRRELGLLLGQRQARHAQPARQALRP